MRKIDDILDSITSSYEEADWGIPRRKLHKGQEEVVENARRFNVVACGRRWGKTILGKEKVIDSLQRGELVAWGAPTYKLLEEPMHELIRDLEPYAKRVNRSEKIIEMPNGGVINFWTLTDPDPGRGYRYHRWVIDEAAMIPDLKKIWQAAIRPTLTDFKGDAWFLSTPRGPTGFFAEQFREGQGDGTWKSFRMPTSTNPHIDEEEIEEAKNQVADSVFKQEYLAEFVMPAGAVFDCFNPDKNVYDPKDVDTYGCPIFLGWDFGPANTAGAVAFEKELEVDGVKQKVLHIAHSYHASGEHPSKHILRVREKLFEKERWAVGGSNSEDRWRKEFQEGGMKIRKPKINGQDSYSVAINIIYYLLATGRLRISKDCKELIDEITSMRYKEEADDKVSDRVENRNEFHRYDAMRYVATEWGDPPVKVKKIGSRLR